MIRRIINIDESRCNGCGLCKDACHEGAIDIIDGKAKLTREHFCDGLGDCLPNCPMGAISFEEREAPAYDEAAVLASQQAKKESIAPQSAAAPSMDTARVACPGSAARDIRSSTVKAAPSMDMDTESKLANWPPQIKLAPTEAPYYDRARLLIAADCTAFAYASTHRDFMSGRTTLIGCPKLDTVDYSVKLTEICTRNDIVDVTVLRMQVPCCGGLEYAVKMAISNSGKKIPLTTHIVSLDGKVLE